MSHRTTTSEPTTTSPTGGKHLLTVEEAAQRLGVGRTTMYGLVASGEVDSITVGRLRRVPPECLDEFISARRHKHAEGGPTATTAA